MIINMQSNIQDLIDKFNNIKEIRKNSETILNNLNLKINAIHKVYLSYIQKTTRSEHNFGLDSFYFQKIMLEQENIYLKQFFSMIDNQIYKDYYKLYRLINKYIKESIIDKNLSQSCTPKHNYPIYKDLDNEHTYDFNTTIILHDDIINILNTLNKYTTIKEVEWKNHEGKAYKGFNIENFVNTEKYLNRQIQQQIAMYIDFLDVFIKYHEKYLSRLNIKLKLLYAQIQSDIKFDDNSSPSILSNNSQSLINAFDNTVNINNNENNLYNLLENNIQTNLVIQNELSNILDSLPTNNIQNENNIQNVNLSINIPEQNLSLLEDISFQNKINTDNINISPRLIPLPKPNNTNYNTPVLSVHQTPVPSVHQSPQISRQATPIPSFHQSPVPSVHQSPVHSVHQTPVPSVHQSPQISRQATPIPSVHQTPVPSVHQSPQISRQATPIPSVHQSPQISRQATPNHSRLVTPIQSLHQTPLQSKQITPISSIQGTPIHSRVHTPLPLLSQSPLPSKPQTPILLQTPIQSKTCTPLNISQNNSNFFQEISYQNIQDNINDIVLNAEISHYNKFKNNNGYENINENQIQDDIIIDNVELDIEEVTNNRNNLTQEEYNKIISELKDIAMEVPPIIEYGKMQNDPEMGNFMPL